MWSKLRRVSSLLDGHSTEIVTKARDAFLLRVCGTGMAFVFSTLIARRLGADGAGLYFLSQTIVFLAVALGRGGLGHAMLKFIANAASAKDWDTVKAVFGKGLFFSSLWSATIGLLLWILARTLAVGVFGKPDLETPLRWMALAVVPGVLLIIIGESLKGLKRIKSAIAVNGVLVPMGSLVVFVAIGERYGVLGAAFSFVSANIVAALAGGCLWRLATPDLVSSSGGEFDTRSFLKSSIHLYHIVIMGLFLTRAPGLFLGVWGTKADIGVFDIAFRTAMLTSFVLNAMNSIIPAKIAELYQRRDMELLDRTIRRMAFVTALLASPAVAFFLLMPSKVMVFFGPDFVRGAPALAILAVGQFVNAAVGSVGFVLIMTGREKILRNITLAMMLLVVALSFLLIPRWGVVGAAWAGAITAAGQNLVASFVVMRKFGIRSLPWPRFLLPSKEALAESLCPVTRKAGEPVNPPGRKR